MDGDTNHCDRFTPEEWEFLKKHSARVGLVGEAIYLVTALSL